MPRFSKYFDGNQYFPKILTKINISENFDPNQEFYKLWPKSRFSKYLTKFDNLKILAKIKIEDKSRIPRILTEIEIFKKFDRNWDFPKILTKIHIFGNYDQNRDFSKILTKIKVLRNFWTKLSKNFDQHRKFQGFFFFFFFTKIEIISENAVENRNFRQFLAPN